MVSPAAESSSTERAFTRPQRGELPKHGRLRPRDALRAMRRLLENPDDTAQVFTIVEALSGRSGERNLEKFRRTPTGAEVLNKRASLLGALRDRKALESLPEGSLGRAYLRFVDEEGINADGLVDASETGSLRRAAALEIDEDLELFADRMRDMHDLWHTVTGYKGDLLGEASLLAFSFAQTWNPGIGFIVSVALLRMGRFRAFGAQRLVLEGFARGLRAAWLPAQDWEALLPLDLGVVRRRLRIGTLASYEPIRSWMVKESRLVG